MVVDTAIELQTKDLQDNYILLSNIYICKLYLTSL